MGLCVSRKRRILLYEAQVTNGPEAGRKKCGHEAVNYRPPVEGDTEAVRTKHAVEFRKRGFQPLGVIVVCHSSTVSRRVRSDVGRVRQNKADALGRKGL
jgi:hypothetical protein